MHNPGSDLSADELRTLKNLPEKLGNPANDPAIVAALVQKGYAQQLFGVTGKSKKGDQAIRHQR